MTTPTPNHGARAAIQDGVVDVLERSGQFDARTRRLSLIEHLAQRRHSASAIPQVDHQRTDLLFIVRDCTQAERLTDLLDLVDGDLNEQSRWRLRQLNDEWEGIAHFSDEDWLTIKDALEQVDVSNGGTLFRTARSRNPRPVHCRSVWHLFAHLAGSNSDDQGVPFFMTFLWGVADQLETSQGRPLKKLLYRMASEWNITEAFQRLTFDRHAVRTGDQNAALLIAIDRLAYMSDTFTVTYWYGWDDSPTGLVKGSDRLVSQAHLQKAVQGIVQTVEAEWPTDDAKLQIEFLLAYELLNLPVEQWPKEWDEEDGPVPLYVHYTVVVRSLDRIRARGRHRVWRSRWHVVQETPMLARCQHAADVPNRLEQTVSGDTRIVSVVLSEPPLPAGAGMKEIRIAIRTGVPIIIWHRTQPPDARFRQVVDDAIGFGEIVDLPDRAFKLRLDPRMTDDERSSIGRNLVILWDNPLRLPQEFRTVTSEEG